MIKKCRKDCCVNISNYLHLPPEFTSKKHVNEYEFLHAIKIKKTQTNMYRQYNVTARVIHNILYLRII